MEINLLGPLEILRDGVVLTPSAPKLRTVFSLLVVHANKVVRTDRIIDEVWEENPPNSVTTTLQTYIYQLRKLLQLAVPPGNRYTSDNGRKNVSLRTSPYGYVLTLAPESLDSVRFERLANQGRAEIESGAFSAAANTLSAALRLWRGSPLVDVCRGPALQTEILRLEEMHKNALEYRIDADLQLGRHHELLGELTRLAAQQPTDEGIQARLMLALYRAGRRSEALKVYLRTRRALATELGLDPSSALRQLHHNVLTADPNLDPPTPRRPVQVQVIKRPQPPRQLPPEGPALVGRDQQEAAALAALTTGQHHNPPVVLVVGPPGSGKSALCTRVGHLASSRYPDGQLYAKLTDGDGRPVEPGEVLAEFLRSVGVPDERIPASTGERCRLFRTCTADQRMLITLDDAVSMRQLRPLSPSSGGCGLLVAGRRRLAEPAITATVELRPLSTEDGVRLLTTVFGEHRVAQERKTLRQLIRLCDGLPTALHLAAARLQARPHWQLSRLVDWISAEIARPSPDGLNLHASVARTFRLASPTAQTAFHLLSALDLPWISPSTAARTLGTTDLHAEALLDELVELHLVQVDPGVLPNELRYRVLPVLRAVGRQLPPEEAVVPDLARVGLVTTTAERTGA